jgi:hypothetical protein
MLSSGKGRSIALGVAMFMVCIAATAHVQSRPQRQTLSSSQMDVLAMMSQLGNLPDEAAVQP